MIHESSSAPSRLARSDEEPCRNHLSAHGSSRATAYYESSKIISFEGRTHVTWLDSVEEGFRVRVRTREEKTGQWSPAHTVGEAEDNHGGPALTVDSQGYLHIVYGPHTTPFRYRRSRRPNDASAWEPEVQFGQTCTYPTLLCGPDDTLYLAGRLNPKSGRQAGLFQKPPGEGWRGPRVILQSLYPGYAQFSLALAWGPDHRTLHLSCRVHEKADQTVYGKYQTVGYLVSHDYGQTWHRGDGARVETPVTSRTIDAIASGGKHEHTDLKSDGILAVDRDNRPWLMYGKYVSRVDHPLKQETPATRIDPSQNEVFLVSLQPDGSWRHRPLRKEIVPHWPDWELRNPSGAMFDREGRLLLGLERTSLNLQPERGEWGHPSSEVLWMESDDAGRHFTVRPLTEPDPDEAHWLANMERPTGFNPVDRPSMLYTAGSVGQNNRQILANDVYWVRP